MHYVRWQRHGDPNFTKSPYRGDDEARFLSKIERREPKRLLTTLDVGPCWIWIAPTSDGRGRFMTRKAGPQPVHPVLAHRWAYEHWIGPIPEGTQLDHFACEDTLCASPLHVRPASPRENVLRSAAPSTLNLRKTHCPAGHPYEGANLYVAKNGDRKCRRCHSLQESARQARLRNR